MDPLSVIASVTGILTAAFKISNTASALISAWKNAPNSLHNLISEMAALSACLAQLMPFLSRREIAPKSRMAAISVEQIIIIASSCVLAVSELQRLLDSIGLEKPLSKRVKLRWSSYEKKINTLLSRVQASASSLNLVLTTLTCSSAEESRQSVSRLERTLFEVLQKDPDLAHRISNIGSTPNSVHYTPSINVGALNNSEDVELPMGSDEIIVNKKRSSHSHGKPSFGLDGAIERSLATSFVYLRADGRKLNPALSSNSSVGSGCGWSFLSEISLAQVSNLSVLSLPLPSHGLWRPEQYRSSNEDEIASYISQIRDTESQHIKSQTLPTSQANTGFYSSFNKPLGFRSKQATAKYISDSIDHNLNLEQKKSKDYIKILLLGVGEAGKSTLIKMMRLMWAGGFDAEDRSQSREVIQSNILEAFKIILNHSPELNPDSSDEQALKHKIVILATESPIETLQQSLDVVHAWSFLWRENCIKNSYDVGNEYALHDNFARFSEDLLRLLSPDLVPTDADVLHARLRTTGITETAFHVDSKTFHVFDHGGAGNERKKWIYSFEGNDCLIYVAPLSGYNQCLNEDFTANQLKESLVLFEDLLSLTWFKRSPIFLVLSKKDLLIEKIESYPITKWWPEYEGSPDDPEEVLTFIKNKFLELADMAGRSVKVYTCELTDKASARVLLDDLREQPWDRYWQTS